MILNALRHNLKEVFKVIHDGALVFERKAVEFHHIDEEGRLIIRGAWSAIDRPEGVYLDCKPRDTTEWIDPQVENGVLILRQANTATMNGTTLEVR